MILQAALLLLAHLQPRPYAFLLPRADAEWVEIDRTAVDASPGSPEAKITAMVANTYHQGLPGGGVDPDDWHGFTLRKLKRNLAAYGLRPDRIYAMASYPETARSIVWRVDVAKVPSDANVFGNIGAPAKTTRELDDQINIVKLILIFVTEGRQSVRAVRTKF